MGFRCSSLGFGVVASLCVVGCDRDSADSSSPPPRSPEEIAFDSTWSLDARDLCSEVSTDEAISWTLDEGPREVPSLEVAIADGALFVRSPLSLRRSRDGGTTFERLNVPASFSGEAPFAGFDGELFAATEAGVWRSADQGDTWRRADVGLDVEVASFHGTKKALLAIGLGGTLHRWSSADAAWSTIELGEEAGSNIAVSDGTTLLVDTGASVLRRSAASDWIVAEGLDAWGYRDLLIDRQVGLAITAAGALRRSEDAGVTWRPVRETTSGFGSALRTVSSNEALLLVTDLGIARSSDHGFTWEMKREHTSDVAHAKIAEEGGIIIVDAGGVSLSVDAGATWTESADIVESTPVRFARVGPWLLTSTASKLVHASIERGDWDLIDTSGYALRAVDSNDDGTHLLFSARAEGEIGFGSSWVSRTRDGGTTFEPIALPEGEQFFGREFDSLAATGRSLFIGGKTAALSRPTEGPGVWRTRDGSGDWVLASDGLPILGEDDFGLTRYPGILAMTKLRGALLVLLDGYGVFESEDDGETWARVGGELPAEHAAMMDDIHVSGADIYLTSRAEGAPILRWDGTSKDGEWRALPLVGLPSDVSVSSFASVGDALVVAVLAKAGEEGSGVFVSRDGGASFRSFGLTRRVRSLFVDGSVLFAGVEGEGVYAHEFGLCL